MLVLPPTSERALRGAPVAVLDFETTGPDPETAIPVQIAVVHCALGDDEPSVVYRTLVQPGVPIPAGASAVHHIFDADVADAPTWPEVLPGLLAALQGRVLAAYNLPYDWTILARGVRDAGYAPEALPFGTLDPLVWAQVVQKYKAGKKLVDVAGRYGIPVDAHDAAGDALATALVMPRLLHDLGRHADGGRAPLMSVDAMWRWTCTAARAVERERAEYHRRQGKTAFQGSWTPRLDVLGG
ncbi:MAG: hypothetical protein RLZZ383_2045 [Pseudomonadota bacterium]|jgi:DNA polymerase-3 subunit epsilon